ncbi:hypothetical protein D3C76_1460660 [compost metagenome]
MPVNLSALSRITASSWRVTFWVGANLPLPIPRIRPALEAAATSWAYQAVELTSVKVTLASVRSPSARVNSAVNSARVRLLLGEKVVADVPWMISLLASAWIASAEEEAEISVNAAAGLLTAA